MVKKIILKTTRNILSPITTPWLILITSMSSLYSENRLCLDFSLIQVWQIWISFIIIYCFGFGLQAFTKKYMIIKKLYFLYLLLGPLFSLYFFVISMFNSNQSIIFAIGLVCTIIPILIFKVPKISHLKNYFSIISLIIIFSELTTQASFFTRKKSSIEIQTKNLYNIRNDRNYSQQRTYNNLPNIYHLILDEISSDLFLNALTENDKIFLKDYYYFPKNLSLFNFTRLSLNSIFSNELLGINTPFPPYHTKSLQEHQVIPTKLNLISALSKKGYYTKVYSDLKISSFSPANILNSGGFFFAKSSTNEYQIDKFLNVWIYQYLPLFISKALISNKNIFTLQKRTFFLFDQQKSYINLNNNLDLLKKTPSKGQYQLIFSHFSHGPYWYNKDCLYIGSYKASENEAGKCIVKKVKQFIKTIKKIDGYDDAFVLIHSDHGYRYSNVTCDLSCRLLKQSFSKKIQSKLSVLPLDQFNAFLLFKPPAKKNRSNQQLTISQLETSLIDISPTILDLIKSPEKNKYPGISFLNPNSDTTSKKMKSRSRFAIISNEAMTTNPKKVYIFNFSKNTFSLNMIKRKDIVSSKIPLFNVNKNIRISDTYCTEKVNNLSSQNCYLKFKTLATGIYSLNVKGQVKSGSQGKIFLTFWGHTTESHINNTPLYKAKGLSDVSFEIEMYLTKGDNLITITPSNNTYIDRLVFNVVYLLE